MSAVPVIGSEWAENEPRDVSRGWTPYHYAIPVVSLVSRKFFSTAETWRTDVNAVAGFADGICAFDPNGVGEIATTAVAFDLKARLCYGFCRYDSARER